MNYLELDAMTQVQRTVLDLKTILALEYYKISFVRMAPLYDLGQEAIEKAVRIIDERIEEIRLTKEHK